MLRTPAAPSGPFAVWRLRHASPWARAKAGCHRQPQRRAVRLPSDRRNYLPLFIFAAISSADSCVSSNTLSESKPKAVCRQRTAAAV